MITYIDTLGAQLTLFKGSQSIFSCPISTAKNGLGETINSECTPRGWHKIRAIIGQGAPIGTVFVSRRQTGEIFSPSLKKKHPNRDWILTRICWLSGLTPGFNRLGRQDTMQRMVYLHACADDGLVGIANQSRGCICLKHQDIIQYCNLIAPYHYVYIQ